MALCKASFWAKKATIAFVSLSLSMKGIQASFGSTLRAKGTQGTKPNLSKLNLTKPN